MVVVVTRMVVVVMVVVARFTSVDGNGRSLFAPLLPAESGVHPMHTHACAFVIVTLLVSIVDLHSLGVAMKAGRSHRVVRHGIFLQGFPTAVRALVAHPPQVFVKRSAICLRCAIANEFRHGAAAVEWFW